LDHFPKKSYGSFPPTNPIWIISPKKLGVNIKAIKEKNEVSPHHLGKMAGRQGNCATISRRGNSQKNHQHVAGNSQAMTFAAGLGFPFPNLSATIFSGWWSQPI